MTMMPGGEGDFGASARKTARELPARVTALVRYCGRIGRLGATLLWNHNVTAMSAALSFRTIFAMIPVLVLVFLVLKSVGVVEDSKQALRGVLEASGFDQIALVQPEADPAEDVGPDDPAGERMINVADEIEQLVERVEAKLTIGLLGPVGIVLLIYTATTLLTSMERSLNRIFSAPRSRSLARRVPLYWSAMTLGPVLVVAASYLSEQASSMLEDVGGVAWLLTATGQWAAPFVGFLLLFMGLYKLLPNTDVPWRAVLTGALFAAPAWLLAKWLFAIYLREIVATGNLYGALGLVPIFLIWLNLSWLIFLYGAELAYVSWNLGSLHSLVGAEQLTPDPRGFLAAMLAVARLQDAGRGPVPLETIQDKLNLPDERVRGLLDELVAIGAACSVDADGSPAYVLARPAHRISVLEVLRLVQPNGEVDISSRDPEIRAAISRFQQQTQSALGAMTLDDLIRAKPDTANG